MDEILEMWEECVQSGARAWETVAHLVTRTLPATIAVGLVSGSWHLVAMALGLGLAVQFIHASKHHPDQWTASAPVYLAGLALVFWGTASLSLSWAWLAMLVGLSVWESGWHRWQHRGKYRPEGFNDGVGGYPTYARHIAWAGLALAALAAIAERLF